MVPIETSITLAGPPSLTAALLCRVVPNTTEYVSTWTTPAGILTLAGVNFRAFGTKYGVINGEFGNNYPQGSILTVNRLSYLDAGNYTCSIAFTGGAYAGPTHSADIELILLGRH